MSKVVEFSQIDKIKENQTRKQEAEQYEEWIEEDCIELVNHLKTNPEIYKRFIHLLDRIATLAIQRNKLLKGSATNDQSSRATTKRRQN